VFRSIPFLPHLCWHVRFVFPMSEIRPRCPHFRLGNEKKGDAPDDTVKHHLRSIRANPPTRHHSQTPLHLLPQSQHPKGWIGTRRSRHFCSLNSPFPILG